MKTYTYIFNIFKHNYNYPIRDNYIIFFKFIKNKSRD